ncbi:uncharacterized protein RJT21DRAFT_27336 [Scheffersomyces amazonensis]|uniref:uncharacterized protein n=1 Tax=Scheffersomyces amazonensis TaxID=1078765 RepID=UPI00315D2399
MTTALHDHPATLDAVSSASSSSSSSSNGTDTTTFTGNGISSNGTSTNNNTPINGTITSNNGINNSSSLSGPITTASLLNHPSPPSSPSDSAPTIVVSDTSVLLDNPNNPPRKRSKVSRACDACRRKKVRCNAEYSSTLQKVTKICNNCIKNSENCTFSRVPLKRGPSKGYIRDLEEKLDKSAQSPATIQIQNTVIPITSATMHHQPLPFPQGHWKPAPPSDLQTTVPVTTSTNNNNNSTTNSANTNSPIILPPLLNYQAKILPSVKVASGTTNNNISNNNNNNINNTSTNSNPSSPRSHSITGLLNSSSTPDIAALKNSSPPIQGPFWKVPYEMPHSRSRRSSVALNDDTSSTEGSEPHHHRRRSSIDSISSTSTTGSRLPSLKPSISVSSDVMSDTDTDDFYSIKSVGHNRSASATRSRRNSLSLSPRNSVSSLSSLSGRMNKTLHIHSNNSSTPTSLIPSPVVAPSLAPPQSYPFPLFAQPQPQQQPPHPFTFPPVYQPTLGPPPPPPKIPVNNIETNLAVYYNHFHASFPILPFNQKHMVMALEQLDDPATKSLVDLFNHALNNLNNFKQLTLNDNISILTRVLALYPLNNVGIAVSDSVLVLLFSALLILNYTILLNGDIYSLGLSLTATIFNDFKVLENFVEYSDNEVSTPNYDTPQLYLPKLYYALNIIDNLYSLSFGISKSINNNDLVSYLQSHAHYLYPPPPPDSAIRSGLLMFHNSPMLTDLVEIRNKYILNRNRHSDSIIPTFWATTNSTTNTNNNNTNTTTSTNSTTTDFSTYFIGLINDKFELIVYLLEINNHLPSTHSHHDSEDVYDTVIDYNLKLIRLVKKLASSIVSFANFMSSSPHNDPPSPNHHHQSQSLHPINPLLNITIGQLFKLIKLNKLIIDSLIVLIQSASSTPSRPAAADIINRCIKINNDLSISFNLLSLNLANLQLGSIAINLIRNKMAAYKLNFNLSTVLNTSSSDLKSAVDNWSSELSSTILPFIERENIEGWY